MISTPSYHDLVDLTDEQMMEHTRCPSTLKCYKSNISILIRFLTPLEQETYLLSGQLAQMVLDTYPTLMKKSIPMDVMSRILRESQIKEEVDGTKFLKSPSSFKSYCAAIQFWYMKSREFQKRMGTEDFLFEIIDVLDDEFVQQIHMGMDGIEVEAISCPSSLTESMSKISQAKKRVHARSMGDGDIDSSAKVPLSMEAYEKLSFRALNKASSSGEAVIIQPFLLLAWNLMARSITVSDLLWRNIGWSGDHVTITYERSKTDQEGINQIPRAIYANPFNPSICPILALGLKVCSESSTDARSAPRLFHSEHANKLFSAWLCRTLNDGSESENDFFGVAPNTIGTHSFRKGAATYVCGLTSGPDSDAVKLRMEHSLGGSNDTYIRRDVGQDRVVGRAVVGLDRNGDCFSILPPHFNAPVCIDEVIPVSLLRKLPPTTKAALPYLVASVLYHWDWITQNLSRQHSFFSSTLYTQRRFRDEWSNRVVLGKFCNPDSGLTGTGIPIDTKILYLLEQLIEKSSSMESTISARTASLVVDQLAVVNGVALHTRAMLQEMLAPMNSVMERLERRIVINERPNQESSVENDQPNFRTFFWEGEHHFFPADFKLPVVSSVALWRLWLFGDDNAVNIPYRYLDGKHMSKSQRTQLSKARGVMDRIRETIGKTYAELAAEGIVEAEKQFSEAYFNLMRSYKRHSSMTFSTAYKHLKSNSNDNPVDQNADSDTD